MALPLRADESCIKFYEPELHWLEKLIAGTAIEQTPQQRIKHNRNKYALGRLSQKKKVKDQCSLGSCWAHGGLEMYEYRAQHNGAKVTLAPSYLVLHHLQNLGWAALQNHGSAANFPFANEGNINADFQKIVATHGFIPKYAWNPGILNLNNSSDVSRFMINFNLVIAHLRNTPPVGGINEAYQILTSYLHKYLGYPKRNFKFRGEPLNALQFSQLPIFAPLNKREKLIVSSSAGANNVFKMVVDQLLATGEPVPISLIWVPSFIDRESGIMSIKAFDPFNTSNEYHTHAVEQRNEKSIGGHLMAVVDFDVDAKGNPIKLLVKNSYGDGWGDEGYSHMYFDYFEKYLDSVIVDSNKED
jgi:hypothetical protein